MFSREGGPSAVVGQPSPLGASLNTSLGSSTNMFMRKNTPAAAGLFLSSSTPVENEKNDNDNEDE